MDGRFATRRRNSLTNNMPKKSKTKNDDHKQDIDDSLQLIEEYLNSYDDYLPTLEKLKELKKSQFVVEDPKAPRHLPSLTAWQIVESVWQKLKRPSSSYHSDSLDPAVAQVVRDGVETVMEEGGFSACLTEKPAAYNKAVSYGEAHVMVVYDPESEYKVRYETLEPDQVFVDSHATVAQSKRKSRKVTRGVYILSYDIKQAERLYHDKEFSAGKIPRSSTPDTSFDKTTNQESQAKPKEVEFALSFDIRDKDDPKLTIFAGNKADYINSFTGKNFPYMDENGKPFIPVDKLRTIDSEEGYHDYGYLHYFYKYIITRRRLLNKAINQSMLALNDTQILNTPKGKGGNTIQQIRESRKRTAQGEKALIINDSGEAIQVTKVEADSYDRSLELLYQQLDRELKRSKINIDAIRQTSSTSATQIITEEEAEDETALQWMNRNTNFFKNMNLWTMQIIKEFVSAGDKTPIRTTAKRFKKMKVAGEEIIDPETGQPVIETDEAGKPEEEKITGVTLGEIKKILDEHKIFVEINTKSGVRRKDSVKAASAILLGQTSGHLPGVAQIVAKQVAAANNIEIDSEVFSQPQPQQGQEAGEPTKIPQGGLKEAAKNLAL